MVSIECPSAWAASMMSEATRLPSTRTAAAPVSSGFGSEADTEVAVAGGELASEIHVARSPGPACRR